MLKPSDPPMATGPDEERSVSELVHQLVEDGKAFAAAELDLAKAVAIGKADGLKLPAMLFAAAFLLLQAAVTAMAVAVFVAFAPRFGPILAGLAALLLFGGAAAGLAWLGAKKLREAK